MQTDGQLLRSRQTLVEILPTRHQSVPRIRTI